MPQPAAADPQIAFIFRRSFSEQVVFFRGKLGNLVPTARWDDIWKSAHDRAFMVAGAAKADLLADLAAAVDKAIIDGETLDKFRKRFAEIVHKHGWHGWTGEKTAAGRAWRTRVIYQTNLATSYATGRLAQLRDAGFRFWVYRHSGSEHPRLQHLAWDGLTLPANHPFWQTHYPPNGFGCKCRVVGADGPNSIRRAGGKPGYTEPPAGWDTIDQKTGEPPGIDKGWGYMPGATSDLVREIERKAVKLPQLLEDALKEDVASRFKTKLKQAFDDVISRAKADGPKIEYAALLDESGARRWIKRGGDDYVQFTSQELQQMRGAILVHNHPSAKSLSREDIKLAGTHGIRRIYAVSNDGSNIYAATVRERNVDRLIDRYSQYDAEVYSVFVRKIHRGEITVSEAERWHHHVMNALASIEGIVSYRVIGSIPTWVKEIIRELRPA
jgi:hypothetical protein